MYCLLRAFGEVVDLRIWLIRHHVNHMRENAIRAITWRLPHWLIYHAAIRAWANATTGPYGREIATDVKADKVVKRWADRMGGDPSFQNSPSRMMAAYAEAAWSTAPSLEDIQRAATTIRGLTYDEIKYQGWESDRLYDKHGIRPGTICVECGSPITAADIEATDGAVLDHNEDAYHYQCYQTYVRERT